MVFSGNKADTHLFTGAFGLVPGDTVSTTAAAELLAQLDNQSLIKVQEASLVSFSRGDEKLVKLHLEQGGLYVSLNEKLNFRITTPDSETRVTGTQFVVQCNGLGTSVAVFRGSVEFTSKVKGGREQTTILTAGETIFSGEHKQSLTEKEWQNLQQSFRKRNNTRLIEDVISSGRLQVLSTIDGVTLSIDEQKITENFDKNINLNLLPGEYTLKLEKTGFEPYTERISLVTGQNLDFEINLVEKREPELTEDVQTILQPQTVLPVNEVPPTAKSRGSWQVQMPYQYKNLDTPGQDAILGFAVGSRYAVAVTQTEVICFDNRGEFLWSNPYSLKEERLFFDSRPLLYKDNVYLASNQYLIIIDLPSREEQRIPAQEMLNNGTGMVLYKEKILIPYPESVYLYDPAAATLDDKPWTVLAGPSVPVFDRELIYLSSYVSGEVAAFNTAGEKLHQYPLTTKSAIPIAAVDGSILAGDEAGNLYKLSPDLQLINILNLLAGIASLTVKGQDSLYVETLAGELFLIDPVRMVSVWQETIEEQPQSRTHYYRSLLVQNDRLYAGTNAGDILILDSQSGEVVESVQGTRAGISCSLVPFGNGLLAGTAAGEVLILKYVFEG